MDVGGFRPGYPYRPPNVVITPFSFESIGVESYIGALTPPASNNFVTANLAVFIPFGISEPVIVTKLFWGNGGAVAGNLDAGIYDPAGVRLVSTGSVAQAGTNTVQVTDITDIRLARGVYYLAFASDTSGITQKVFATVTAAGLEQGMGLLQMSTAFPLPATATFAIYASAFLPLVGLQATRAVGP